jgi:hypothetical protein
VTKVCVDLYHGAVIQRIYNYESIMGELLPIIRITVNMKSDSTSSVLVIGAGPSGLAIDNS